MPNAGNRQDNRQRGNAAQLHEKYKALARDAQLAGDRVQTEYYLQFADHYFRVLNEGRARFEEQRRQRDDFAGDEEEQDEARAATDGEDREEREDSEQQAEAPVEYSNGSGNRRERRGRRPERAETQERSEPAEPEAAAGANDEAEERISVDVLPPAISAEPEAPSGRRRRTRRARPTEDGEAEVAPAA